MSWLLVHMHVERWKDFSFGEKKKGISWVMGVRNLARLSMEIVGDLAEK